MRTLLEMISIGGRGLLTVGGSLMIMAIAREGRHAHAVDASSVGPVGSPDGLDPGGRGRGRVRVGSAVRRTVRRAAGGYAALERWLGARIPAWVGLPWLRMRRVVKRGRHAGAQRAKRATRAVVTSHRHGVRTVRQVRVQLYRDAVRILAARPYMTRASVVWAEGVLS